MVDAADSIIIFVILASQPWLFINQGKQVTSKDVPTNVTGPEHAADRQHDSFLQRVSEYPSVVDIRSPNPRPVVEQRRKLRALSMALGLAENDPYTRYHPEPEKRATVIMPEIEHHPYSVGAHNMGSKLSLKSVEYGVALGHPSRDASVQHSLEAEHGTPNHGRAASLVIISTPSEGSSHAIHLPLEEEASALERQRRVPLSPLATNGLNGSHWKPRLASDISPPYSAPPTFDRTKRGHDLPHRPSYLAISMESSSPSTSPLPARNIRTSADTYSLQPPSVAHSHHLTSTQELSTGEASSYEASDASSSPHILVDDIASSVLSWPNISRSTLAFPQHRFADTGTPTSVGFSHSSFTSESRWRQYNAGSPEEPPHPLFMREDTPSPLSLNDQAGSIGGHTFGESPVERRFHPYTRGPSPLRPPGLGSPLPRWTEEIEETARTTSEEL